MTEQPIHPMQPSAEQFGEWLAEARRQWPGGQPGDIAGIVARLAYAAGADAELEACIRHLDSKGHHPTTLDCLRAARRPKPPSLKQQALKALDAIEGDFNTVGDRAETIRRALELLPDD